MKPVDCKTETWKTVLSRVEGLRMDVYRLLQEHGPATTRQLALKSGRFSVLTIRPRITELCQLNLARCVGRERHLAGSDGIYEAIALDEAEKSFELRRAAGSGQGVLF